MRRKFIVAICAIGFFAVGWLGGLAQSGSQTDAAGWRSLSDDEKTLFAWAFQRGYTFGAADSELLAEKIPSPERAFIERAYRDLTSKDRNLHLTPAQIKGKIADFYGDNRNQGVCWEMALTLSAMTLSADPPTQHELEVARKGSGCKQ